MFTGIVEELGSVKAVSRISSGGFMEIGCVKVLEDVNIGDSIAVNGVCLTVTGFTPVSFRVDVSWETFDRTSLKSIRTGSAVNLERAMPANGRFGGHIVLGHVDGVCSLAGVEPRGDFWEITVNIPLQLRKYVSEKGSVTIDGISLTVARDYGSSVLLAVIPHTYENTNLRLLRTGDTVNLEVDVVARYLDKMVNYGSEDDRLLKLIKDL